MYTNYVNLFECVYTLDIHTEIEAAIENRISTYACAGIRLCMYIIDINFSEIWNYLNVCHMESKDKAFIFLEIFKMFELQTKKTPRNEIQFLPYAFDPL